MNLQRRSRANQFYGNQSEPMVIDANPFRASAVATPSNQRRALAVSVHLDGTGEVVVQPFHIGVNKSSEDLSDTESTSKYASVPLDYFLTVNEGKSIMLDVAGTSPKLIVRVAQIIKTLNCGHRICCGSRFDAVGESLSLRLPEALHFMPRTRRARLTLNLLLNYDLPDVRPFSVINLPMAFEGLDIVTTSMIQRMQVMGIALNVISNDDPMIQHKLSTLGVDAMIVNLAESPTDRSASRTIGSALPPIVSTSRLQRHC